MMMRSSLTRRCGGAGHSIQVGVFEAVEGTGADVHRVASGQYGRSLIMVCSA